ncbi:MAG: DUF1549 domain-containing protein [Planctomycetota bacterium]
MGCRLIVGALPALLFTYLIWPSEPATADQTGLRQGAAKRMAARIDAIVDKELRAAGLKPAGLADEATYARRTYLGVAGRIPNAIEMRAYKRKSSTDKSYDLVDELLASKGYESHQFNWWADLLRTRTRLAQRTSGEPYMHWLKQSIADNKAYDTMVRELLTASGPVHARDNGATGYFMRDRNMQEDNMSNTIRVFLGSRVECAQCHNHPFDKWTQKQYFEMVAFTGGIQYQKSPRGDPRMQRLVQEARKRWGRNGQRAVFRILQPTFIGIYGNGTGASQLPQDYQYDDHKPHDLLEASPLFDPPVFVDVHIPDRARQSSRNNNNRRRNRAPRLPEVDSRKLFADWMTSPRNDAFARTIANRVWKKLMGRAIVEPEDDFKDDSTHSSKELLDHLTALVVELDYDLREFQRILLYTKMWRREAISPSTGEAEVADLRGPALRRMSAEQAWDSLLTLVVPNLDGRLLPPLNPRTEAIYSRFDKLLDASDEEIMAETADFVLRYTDRAAFQKRQREKRQEQQAKRRQAQKQMQKLYRDYRLAERRKNTKRMDEIKAELEERGLPIPGENRGRRAGRAVRDLQRASDLPSPAPNGHLLRELGQSPRELIQEGHSDPTVPQILALLNAFLEQRVLTNRSAEVMRDIQEARGNKGKIDAAFLGVLGRKPTSEERRMWERDIAKGGERATQDLVWTLVNTHEFLFIQ